MRVKLNRDLLVGATDHQPGDVVEVPEDRARWIVAQGDGVALDEFTTPEPAPPSELIRPGEFPYLAEWATPAPDGRFE